MENIKISDRPFKPREKLKEWKAGGSSPTVIAKSSLSVFIDCIDVIDLRLMELEGRIRESAESSGKLGDKVHNLNKVLAGATITIALATIINILVFYYK